MNEQPKIDEACYFFDTLRPLIEQRDKFRYHLSAFLSAARSPLQYACNEAKHKSGGQTWYDSQVTANPVVKFFKEKRNVSIHEKLVSPSGKFNLSAGESLSLSESVSVTITRADGSTEAAELVETPAPPVSIESDVSATFEYFFDDWPGSEDVITLCKRYLNEVEAIVADGVTKKFLTL